MTLLGILLNLAKNGWNSEVKDQTLVLGTKTTIGNKHWAEFEHQGHEDTIYYDDKGKVSKLVRICPANANGSEVISSQPAQH